MIPSPGQYQWISMLAQNPSITVQVCLHGSEGAIHDWIDEHILDWIAASGLDRLETHNLSDRCIIGKGNRVQSITVDLADEYTSIWGASARVRRVWGSWMKDHISSHEPAGTMFSVQPMLWYPEDPCHSHGYRTALSGHPLGAFLCGTIKTSETVK